MKKIRPVFLALLALSVILILATGCFRPAAPDVTPTSSEGAEAATPEEPDIEATAIANATLAAETAAAQTAEPEQGEEPAETSTAPAPTATAEPATPMPTTRPPTPEPTAEATETPVPVGEVTHVVQAGENLFRIALRYDTTVEAIAQANGIANASQIYVGQELTIPAGSAPSEPSQPSPGGMTYVVQPGDNLFRIALRYNISHLRLAEYNGIANPSNIYVGQVIRIPPQ